MKKILKRTTLGLLALYIAACVYMYAQQRRILFNPNRSDVALLVQNVPGANTISLQTPDGETLKAWWVEPRNGAPVYLYLHGNAGNLQGSMSNPNGRAERFAGLTSEGAGLLALSWRGYGGSSGDPTEAGFHIDATTALTWLKAKLPAAKIIVFGESLGTGVAVQLTAKEQVAALILDSPYTSIVDIGVLRYPWLPVRALAKDHFESLAYAKQINVPVLIQHCNEDSTVPYEEGRTLFAALTTSEKFFRTINGKCHVPSILGQLSFLRELEQRFSNRSSAP